MSPATAKVTLNACLFRFILFCIAIALFSWEWGALFGNHGKHKASRLNEYNYQQITFEGQTYYEMQPQDLINWYSSKSIGAQDWLGINDIVISGQVSSIDSTDALEDFKLVFDVQNPNYPALDGHLYVHFEPNFRARLADVSAGAPIRILCRLKEDSDSGDLEFEGFDVLPPN